MNSGPLINRLIESSLDLEEIFVNTSAALRYLSDAITERYDCGQYQLAESAIAGSSHRLRPVRKALFLSDPDQFSDDASALLNELPNLIERCDENSGRRLDRVIYTAIQAHACVFDILVVPGAARKHIGNKFEDLIRAMLTTAGIRNRKDALNIPYNGRTYRCEIDVIIEARRKSGQPEQLSPDDIVVSCKITSKDRMSKIFTDKLLMQNFIKHSIHTAAIFVHDVQRVGPAKISRTFLPGLFLVYWQFITPLDGVFYLDPPPQIDDEAYSDKLAPFHTLLNRFGLPTR